MILDGEASFDLRPKPAKHALCFPSTTILLLVDGLFHYFQHTAIFCCPIARLLEMGQTSVHQCPFSTQNTNNLNLRLENANQTLCSTLCLSWLIDCCIAFNWFSSTKSIFYCPISNACFRCSPIFYTEHTRLTWDWKMQIKLFAPLFASFDWLTVSLPQQQSFAALYGTLAWDDTQTLKPIFYPEHTRWTCNWKMRIIRFSPHALPLLIDYTSQLAIGHCRSNSLLHALPLLIECASQLAGCVK